MKNKYRLFLFLGILMVIFSSAGCRWFDFDRPEDFEFVPMDPDTSTKLANLVRENGGEEILLNLASDDEYDFIRARLGLARKNRMNSPRLFKALEKTRERHQALSGRASEIEEPEQGNKHSLVKVEMNDQERLIVSACGSALEGTSYIYLDCVAADEHWNHLTTYQFNEAYSAERVDVTSDGNISQYVNRSSLSRIPQMTVEYLQVDTLLIYEDAEGQLIVSYYYSGSDSGIIYPVGMKIEAPCENAVLSDDDNIVKICLGRAHNDCDYELYTPQTNRDLKHLVMPFKGYVDFGLPIKFDPLTGYVSDVAVDATGKVVRNLDLALCLSDVGGMVTKREQAEEDSFWHHPNTIVTTGYDRYGNAIANSRLQWDMTSWNDAIDFGQAAFKHCEAVDFFVQITVPLRDTVMIHEERALPGTAFIVPENYFDGTPYFYKPVISDMTVQEGSHFVNVIGKDADGVWQPTINATYYEWTVDTTPPASATLYNTPLSQTSLTHFDIYVDGPEIESYSYKLDANIDGIYHPGSKSNPEDKSVGICKDLTGQSFNSGLFVLSVWGVDKAGNEQEVPTTYSWTIEPGETALVEAELVNVPSFFSDTNQIEVAVSGDDIYYYRYNLDNSGWTSTLETAVDGDRIVADNLSDGFHKLEVSGSRNGVVWQAEPSVINWHVDTVPPIASYNVAITGNNYTPATDFFLEVTGDDIVAYEYCLDRGDLIEQNIRDLIYENDLAVGIHYLTIRGRDRAGNWQPQSQATSFNWVIDPDTNCLSLRNVPRTVTNNTHLNIQLKNDLMTSFKYAYDSVVLGDELPIKDFMKMPQIQFAYSCLSADTAITMADGSQKMIPEIEEGELVLAYVVGEQGELEATVMPVFDLVHGEEAIPMYRLADDAGNTLLCTQGHPVVMADGSLKLARDLNPGDKVMTEFGSTKLVMVATEMYNDTIYNLVLGNASERAEWVNSGYIMIGNGYLIGDNTTQTNQQNLAQRKDSHVLARLPREWYIDYFFSQLRKVL